MPEVITGNRNHKIATDRKIVRKHRTTAEGGVTVRFQSYCRLVKCSVTTDRLDRGEQLDAEKTYC